MGPVEQIIHVFNFIAPAWCVALFCALMARLSPRLWLPMAGWSLFKQTLINGVLGTLVLAGGLILWGVDGKMGAYSALIIVCATVQWLMCKGWQR